MTRRSEVRSCYGVALAEALAGLDEGGIPIGAALFRGEELIATGRNRRVQDDDPILHAEMTCFRNAGRRTDYADLTLYSTLAPCPMYTGAILLFQVPRVVVGESRTFAGELDLLRRRSVDVIVLDDAGSAQLMRTMMSAHPELWSEDIGGR
ncbi:nucleoside deaminase [Speluncibacter jeojiensis]|uniref:Nucleoside deaminase n=1 Tax=Speluncibacter jeojiensis TaxID=2710754 RepID=A0A9X4M3S1_9ACTN|nr:nucleoside deaminase [Corynebacteriales bacterium D3-21]